MRMGSFTERATLLISNHKARNTYLLSGPVIWIIEAMNLEISHKSATHRDSLSPT